jgi:hypothetical protein
MFRGTWACPILCEQIKSNRTSGDRYGDNSIIFVYLQNGEASLSPEPEVVTIEISYKTNSLEITDHKRPNGKCKSVRTSKYFVLITASELMLKANRYSRNSSLFLMGKHNSKKAVLKFLRKFLLCEEMAKEEDRRMDRQRSTKTDKDRKKSRKGKRRYMTRSVSMSSSIDHGTVTLIQAPVIMIRGLRIFD